MATIDDKTLIRLQAAATSTWPLADLVMLVTMAMDGHSAMATAHALPGRTRNACIARLDRIARLGINVHFGGSRVHQNRVTVPRESSNQVSVEKIGAHPRKSDHETARNPAHDIQRVSRETLFCRPVTRGGPTDPTRPNTRIASDAGPFSGQKTGPSPGASHIEWAPGRKTIADLSPRCCRYPIGDPGHADFRFCGDRKMAPGVPYCAAHMREAYQPAQTAKSVLRQLDLDLAVESLSPVSPTTSTRIRELA